MPAKVAARGAPVLVFRLQGGGVAACAQTLFKMFRQAPGIIQFVSFCYLREAKGDMEAMALWHGLGGLATAAGLLLAGGIKAIQMASIIVGLPIALLMTAMSYTLIRSLRQESLDGAPRSPRDDRAPAQEYSQQGASPSREPVLGGMARGLVPAV